jgi:hypothetical protein
MPPYAVRTARPGSEKSGRTAYRNKKQRYARNEANKKAKARQAKAAKAHTAKMKWFDAWKKKKIAAINATGRSAAWKRKSRNAVNSKYNRWRAAEQRKFRRITANNYSPDKLTSRTEGDIFEHYDIHRLFSSDLSVGGISDVIAGQISGSTPLVYEEYGAGLNEEHQLEFAVLNLGVSDLSTLITWAEVFDEGGTRTWTASISVPNTDEFTQIKARISG